MDALLRNHQADTTARRLQLERTLAQRQSELRTRTHEVEELTVKLSEARKKVGEMEGEVSLVKSERLRESSEQKKLLQEKVWPPAIVMYMQINVVHKAQIYFISDLCRSCIYSTVHCALV